MAFFEAVAMSDWSTPAVMLYKWLDRGVSLEAYLDPEQRGSITTELKVVRPSPRVFRITFGDHGPQVGRGGVWRVTYTAGGKVQRMEQEGFWVH